MSCCLGGLSNILQAMYSVSQSWEVGFLSIMLPNMSSLSLAEKIVGLNVNLLWFSGVGGRGAASGLGVAVVLAVGVGAAAGLVAPLAFSLLFLGSC